MELRPLPIIEDRTHAQLKADGDNRWPDGSVYTPPPMSTQIKTILAETQHLMHDTTALHKQVEDLQNLVIGYYATTARGADTALLRKRTRQIMPEIEITVAHITTQK
jgi:hypothetical protein